MTNREKLRGLSDRDLAIMIAKKSDKRCEFCRFTSDCPNPYTGSYCIGGISKWLSTDIVSGGDSRE